MALVVMHTEPMNKSMPHQVIAAFAEQANLCEAVGSPFTAAILRSVAATLNRNTQTGRAILDWQGDPMADALKLRIAGGLHALARTGQDLELSALYKGDTSDMDAVLTRVLAQWDGWLLPWLDGPPQTNEVGRSGMLWPGIMKVTARYGPQIELLELGASAGLNLNMDRFGYELCGVKAGDPASSVQLKPDWIGPAPTFAPVTITGRRGVDINPLDPSRDDVTARLIAYVWPDQTARLARIEAAIALSRRHPPVVDKADAADWIEDQLAKPQQDGVARLIFHSIVLQYLPPESRHRVVNAIIKAGAAATAQRPIAWLSMEFTGPVKSEAELRLRSWPGNGESVTLATVHPHGASITWLGAEERAG